MFSILYRSSGIMIGLSKANRQSSNGHRSETLNEVVGSAAQHGTARQAGVTGKDTPRWGNGVGSVQSGGCYLERCGVQ
jgi:hypothetical protein